MFKRIVLVAGVVLACAAQSEDGYQGRTPLAPTAPGVKNIPSARPYYAVDTNDWLFGSRDADRDRSYYRPLGISSNQGQSYDTTSRCYRGPDGTVCTHGFEVSNDAEVKRYNQVLAARKSKQDGQEDVRAQTGGNRFLEGMTHVEHRQRAVALAASTQNVADLRGVQDGLHKVFTTMAANVSHVDGKSQGIKDRFKAAHAALTKSLGETTPLKIASTPDEPFMVGSLISARTMVAELKSYFLHHWGLSQRMRNQLWGEVLEYEKKLASVDASVERVSRETATVQAELKVEYDAIAAGNAPVAPEFRKDVEKEVVSETPPPVASEYEPQITRPVERRTWVPGTDTRDYFNSNR